MKVLYVYRTARRSVFKDYLHHTQPSTMMYGLVELRKKGVQVDFFDRAYNRLNLLEYVTLPLERLFIKCINYPLGYKLHQALILLPHFNEYDVIVTTQDSAGLPILLLKRLGIINKKIVYVCNNLAPLLDNKFKSNLNKFLVWHLQAADSILCFSKIEQQIVNQHIPHKAVYIPFGVDTKFYTPSPHTKYRYDVLSVGRDFLRDYAAFIQAVGNSKLNVAIVCSRHNLTHLKIPSNIHVYYDVPPTQLKKLYAQSKIVVIPMRDRIPKSQGQVVFLEATAMSKPVIASDVAGFCSAFDIDRFANLALVQSGNVKMMRSSINKMLKKYFPKKFRNKEVLKYISMDRFADDINTELTKVCN